MKNVANMNMLRRKKRSTTVVNVMIAIVITLAVNFSYILVMIAEQRENSSNTTNNQPQQQLQQPPQHPEAEGVLHLSRDGYGYIIVKHNISQETPDEGKVDSIFVSNRRVWQYR
jgi:flagellar basal body-associated protein FliL